MNLKKIKIRIRINFKLSRISNKIKNKWVKNKANVVDQYKNEIDNIMFSFQYLNLMEEES